MPTTNSSSLTGHAAEHIFAFANLSLTNFLGSHVSVGHRTKQIKTCLIHSLPGFPDPGQPLFSRSFTPAARLSISPHLWTPAPVLPLPYLCFFLSNSSSPFSA